MQRIYSVYPVFKIVKWACVDSGCISLCSYNASLCRLPQQSSKGDNGRHAGTVEEEEGGHALEAHAIFKITQVERSFPPNIHYETSKQPSAQQNNDMNNDLV